MSRIKEFFEESERVDKNMDKITEQMTGAEIGRKLGITRQAASNTIKRGLKKLFNALLKEHKDWTPLDAAVSIALYFQVDEAEMKKFFKLFPPDIRKKIEADAAKKMPSFKK